ncbi:MAG: hypothetical protein E5V52_02400, partial [Mesorhizobium sp.]
MRKADSWNLARNSRVSRTGPPCIIGWRLAREPMKAEQIASGASAAESPDPRADARADIRLMR